MEDGCVFKSKEFKSVIKERRSLKGRRGKRREEEGRGGNFARGPSSTTGSLFLFPPELLPTVPHCVESSSGKFSGKFPFPSQGQLWIEGFRPWVDDFLVRKGSRKGFEGEGRGKGRQLGHLLFFFLLRLLLLSSLMFLLFPLNG